MAKNFKVFVSSFPNKTAYLNGNLVEVYQINRIVYTEAKEIFDISLAGELYDTATGISVGDECTSNLFGCTEQPVAPPTEECGIAGPPGPRGPAGLPGPPGENAECPPPAQQCGTTYCGYLPGPVPPPPANNIPSCLNEVQGYVVDAGSPAWAASTNGNNGNGPFKANFGYPGLLEDRWTSCAPNNSGAIDIDNTWYNSYFFKLVSGNCGVGGLPHFRGQYTYGEYVQDLSLSPRPWGTRNTKFIPVESLFNSGGFVRLGDWQNVLDGGEGNGLKNEILDAYPDCSGESGPPAPPITDQGDSICSDGTPPDTEAPEGNNACGGGCENPIPSCPPPGGFKDGDTFIDITNGVTYFYSAASGGWQKQGLPNCGEQQCNPPEPEECPPSGCPCDFTITCFCNPPDSPPPGPGGCNCENSAADDPPGCIGTACGNGGSIICSDNCTVDNVGCEACAAACGGCSSAGFTGGLGE